MPETFAAQLYFLWSGSESMPIMYVLATRGTFHRDYRRTGGEISVDCANL